MGKTVTYKGPTRSGDPTTQVRIEDQVFVRDEPVEDVPEKVVKQVDDFTGHRFEVGQQKGDS